MPPVRSASTGLFIGFLFAVSALGKSNQDASPQQAWEKASSFLVNDACEIFKKISKNPQSNTREVRLGLAISLMDAQPKSATNLNKARSTLESLIEDNSSDEVGLFARYALAHYYLLHAPERDFKSAMKIFLELFEQHPQKKVSQLALGYYSMLSLSPQVTGDPEFLSELTELENRAKRLTFPDAEILFHLAVAYAANLRGFTPEKVVTHLRAAQETGLMDSRRLADSYVICGKLALKMGDYRIANEQFSRFVKEFPRDVRNHTIQQTLNQINELSEIGETAREP
jgi:tetratricopeptide (TPR) repeat protein